VAHAWGDRLPLSSRHGFFASHKELQRRNSAALSPAGNFRSSALFGDGIAGDGGHPPSVIRRFLR